MRKNPLAWFSGLLAVGALISPAVIASSAQTSSAPAAVKAFDEAGPSTSDDTADMFTTAQWKTIADDGFKLFITDPIQWSSECSDGNCTKPVNTCSIDSGAVTQLQDAVNAGLDIAVYTRNANCIKEAITGIGSTLEKDLSFAVLDIESKPSVKLSSKLENDVTSTGKQIVIYTDNDDWQAVMGNSNAGDSYPLQLNEVPHWPAPYPAPYPSGYPSLSTMSPFGGWSGYPDIEQQQCCTNFQGSVGTVQASGMDIDLDLVNKSWLASLPHP